MSSAQKPKEEFLTVSDNLITLILTALMPKSPDVALIDRQMTDREMEKLITLPLAQACMQDY